MVKAMDANEIRQKGNELFKKNDFAAAVVEYSAAIALAPDDMIPVLNRAMANLKLHRWSEVERDATTVLGVADNFKARYRRAVARRESGNLQGAREDLEVSLSLCPVESKLNINREMAQLEIAEAKSPSLNFIIGDSLISGDKGCFANRPFQRGQLILADSPLFFCSAPFDDVDVMNKVESLPLAESEEFKSLKGDTPVNIVQANYFSIDEDRNAIFLRASKFNHSCSPNASYSWHSASGHLRIYAIKPIAAGEEIYVSYIKGRNVYGSPRATRQDRLIHRRGLHCVCPTCKLQGKELEDSDRRRREIAAIWDRVPFFMPNQTEARLRSIARAIALLEEEGFAADSDDFAVDAAGICAYHSDWESAKYWATKAYNSLVAEYGADSHHVARDSERGVWLMMTTPEKCPMAGLGPKKVFKVR